MLKFTRSHSFNPATGHLEFRLFVEGYTDHLPTGRRVYVNAWAATVKHHSRPVWITTGEINGQSFTVAQPTAAASRKLWRNTVRLWRLNNI